MLRAIASSRTAVLTQVSIPSGIAPTGTVAANGAVTLGTALARIYGPTSVAPGIWLYFPAGALFSGSAAGLYWCVMTSTTVGTAFNNMPNLATLAPPATTTAIVDAGPGAYTGVTTKQTLFAPTLPGGSMGANGSLRLFQRWNWNNSAGTKTPAFDFGGTQIVSVARTTTLSDEWFYMFSNRGAQNKQITFNAVIPAIGSAINFSSTTIDTSADKLANHTMTLDTATDYGILESSFIEVIPG